MKIEVAYLTAARQYSNVLELPEGASIRMALEYSGVLQQFPEIDLDKQKVGVFGRLKPADALLSDGDRVEIYRPIVADPETVPRRAMPEEAGE